MGSLFIRPAPGLGPGLPRRRRTGGVPWSSWPGSTAARAATSPPRSTSSSGSCGTSRPPARQPTDPHREGARVSTAEFAAFSDNAIMFASIVYVLAFLAHLAEWVFLRSLAGARRGARAAAGRRRRRRAVSRLDGGPDTPTGDSRRTRSCGSRCAGRIGARADRARRALLHFLGLVTPRARPATRSGCPGATCTSSRWPAPSASA